MGVEWKKTQLYRDGTKLLQYIVVIDKHNKVPGKITKLILRGGWRVYNKPILFSIFKNYIAI